MLSQKTQLLFLAALILSLSSCKTTDIQSFPVIHPSFLYADKGLCLHMHELSRNPSGIIYDYDVDKTTGKPIWSPASECDHSFVLPRTDVEAVQTWEAGVMVNPQSDIPKIQIKVEDKNGH